MINFIAEDHQFVCGLMMNILAECKCCRPGTHRRSNYAISRVVRNLIRVRQRKLEEAPNTNCLKLAQN